MHHFKAFDMINLQHEILLIKPQMTKSSIHPPFEHTAPLTYTLCSDRTPAIINSDNFKLKELSEEAHIEVVRDGKDEIIGINIILMEDVKISIGQFLKNIKRFEN